MNVRNTKLSRVLSMVMIIAMLFGVLIPMAYFSNIPRTTAVADRNAVATAGDADYDEEIVYQFKSLEVYPDEGDLNKSVTLDGLMPCGAEANAVDVTDDYVETGRLKTAALDGSMPENGVIAAYDITISESNLADSAEFQPIENYPITVTINDPRISVSENLELWHVKDDGTREKVEDVTVEEGKVCFEADGFSVYEIVDVASSSATIGVVESIDELDGKCFYISNDEYTQTRYMVNTLTGGKIQTTNALSNAIKFYFDKVEDSDNKYMIYYMNDNNPVYLCTKNEKGGNYYYSSIADDAQYNYLFTVKKSVYGNHFYLSSATDTPTDDKQNYWYYNDSQKTINKNRQFSNGDWNNGQQKYVSQTENNEKSILFTFLYDISITDDPYNLNDTSYGIMSYTSGTVGNALCVNAEKNTRLYQLIAHDSETASETRTLYVSDDTDITEWTFINTSEDNYLLYDYVSRKYLVSDGTSLSFTESVDDATAFKVTLGSDGNISLSSGEKYVSFTQNDGFGVSSTPSYLNFVQKTNLNSNDNLIYSASRISVSDGEKAHDGQEVIVYTRIWDDDKKKYNFYAIDHDGSLKPCYPSGDKIMWLDDATNSLLWKFTVYYDDEGKENGYYELQNTYSGKFLAPQLKDDQILSDNKIGINMMGRKYEVSGTPENPVYSYGEYYSNIVAWDKSYYDYASLKGRENSDGSAEIISEVYANADSFYFAILDNFEEEEQTAVNGFHLVETVDNNDYGITIKMKDYNGATTTPAGTVTTVEQHNVMGFSKYQPTDQKTGLLSTDLKSNGYPDAMLTTNKNLSQLFTGSTTVNHLFINSIHESSGYFEFDSCQNYATLVGSNNGDFKVYRELGTHDGKTSNSLKHGQFFPYNDIAPNVYSAKNGENVFNALQEPLPEEDPRKYEKLHLINNPDFYFGMEIEAKFVQTPSGLDAWGHDVVFEFTGDDDFWLYVDGELVIDLGGIHSALGGKVNFKTGDVTVNGVTKTLREVFRDNYIARNSGATDDEINAFLSNYFNDGKVVFKDYTEHTMKIFYMERGGGASNLHMRFNLSSVTPGNVLFAKSLSAHEGHEEDLSDMDYSILQYPFQIMYQYVENGPWFILGNEDTVNHKPTVKYQNSTQTVKYRATYTPPNYPEGRDPYQSVFFLIPNRNIEISFPDDAMNYKIVECAVNTEIYDEVTVNGSNADAFQVSGSIKDLISNAAAVNEQPSINFDNTVKEGNIRTLDITKKLYNENGKGNNEAEKAENELFYSSNNPEKEDKTKFNFRLYLSNGSDDELKLAYLCRYYVINTEGYVCVWDPISEEFESSGIEADNVKNLTDAQKAEITYRTSMYGAISNIPAGYTVRIPGLPAGTKFRVEERDYETPLGYNLIDYECVTGSDNDGTYYTDTNIPGAGTIRAGFNAEMLLNNQRGYGIKVNKSWSDSEYTKSHDDIYFAVYVNGTLLDGSVKCLESGDDYYTYFFERLLDGTTIDDYEVFEVELTSPSVDANGIVTYSGTPKKISSGAVTSIGVTSNKNIHTSEDYSVSYEKGVSEKTVDVLEENNIREDTVTNTRKGGVVINLNQWYSGSGADVPLAGGTFELTCDGDTVGTYISDSEGNITVLYGFEVNKEYVLTETIAPNGYIGIAEPITFTITESNNVYSVTTYSNSNDSDDDADITDGKYWSEYKNAPENGIVAEIDIYNKPYTFKVLKVDQNRIKKNGAVFELHKAITNQYGTIRDPNVLAGYENLVSGEGTDKGIVPKVNETLGPGTYYLKEKTAPTGCEGLAEEVVFTISPLGIITINSAGHEDFLVTINSKNACSYTISVPNTSSDVATNAELTVTKTVKGSMGDKSKEFEFTFEVEGASASDTYEWTKNGVAQTALHSGDTFTLRHNDSAVFTVTVGTDVTVTETAVMGYETTFKLNSADAEEVNTKTFTIADDTTLAVTNTMGSIVPSGVIMKVFPVVAVGLIVVIVLGVLIFRSKRRDDEDEDETDEE